MRLTQTSTILLSCSILIGLATRSVVAQGNQYDKATPPQHAAGVSPLGSYSSADLGTVNLSNGALNLKIPMGSVGGRGFWLPLTLNWSSKIWSGSSDIETDRSGLPKTVVYADFARLDDYVDLFNRIGPGWTVGVAPMIFNRIVRINRITSGQQVGCYTYTLARLTLMLPDKGEIEFRDDNYDGMPLSSDCSGYVAASRGTRWHATDGSGTVFINDVDNGVANYNTSGTVITAEGMRYHFTGERCDWIKDRNGNKITFDYSNGVAITDQLGRITRIQQNVVDPQNPGVTLALLVTLPGYNGQSRYYKVKSGVMNQHYRSDISPTLPVITGDYDPLSYGYGWGTATRLFIHSYGMNTEEIDNWDVLSELILPDGRSLHFNYNTFGEVAEVQMPTGGKVWYDYGSVGNVPAGNSPVWETAGDLHTQILIDRGLTKRRTFPDGSTLDCTWNYSYTATSAQVTASSASGTLLLDQRHYFLASGRYYYYPPSSSGAPDGTQNTLWSTGVEYRSESRDALGNVIAANEEDWAQRTPVVWSSYPQEQPANDNRISEERKILDNGSVAKVQTTYQANVKYNNPAEVKEFDYDLSLKRRTVTTYADSTNLINGLDYTADSIHLLNLPLVQTVYDANATQIAQSTNEYDVYSNDGNHAPLQDYASVAQHDSAFGASYSTRGNLTRQGQWLNTTSSFIYSYPRFDTLGNVVATKDPRGNVTTFSFADDFGLGSNPGSPTQNPATPTYALPTLVTSPPPQPGEPAHTARTEFDYSTGLLTGFRDRNNIVTQTIYNDPFDRPTQVKTAVGVSGVETHTSNYYAPQTVFGITLAKNDVLTASDLSTVDDASIRAWTVTDGFGRTIEAWRRDPQGDVKVITVYDALGRVKQTSNPFRPASESAVYTTSVFDLAGRVTSVTTPDNAVVTTAYSGNSVTVTDQAGKPRRSITDGLGRLTRVDEPDANNNLDSAGSPVQPTSYAYDVLDDLTSVSQGVQTRTFVYDSLKRLTSATNPESGAVTYGYDANGNLTSKVDARSITTTMSYDALNRITSKTYNDTPQTAPINYYYDAQTLPSGAPTFSRGSSTGRLVAVTYGSGSSEGTYRGYDQLGRVVTQYQRTDSVNYLVEASYSLNSSMLTQTYPAVPGAADRRVVSYTNDAVGRLSSLNTSATSYAPAAGVSSIGYASHSALSTETYSNGLIHAIDYNNRLQPTQIRLGTSGNPTSVISLGYTYGTTNNNGNVLTHTYSGGGLSYTQNFGYDSLNRLTTANENGTNWSQTNAYDRYGNRWIDLGGGNQSLYFNTANNRITGSSYDSAGNLLNDGTHAYTYDAENKIAKVDNASAYVYNGEGLRVRKLLGENLRFVYGIGGELIAEFSGATGSLQKEYVYGTSGLLATIEPTAVNANGTRYTTPDHLGSTRVVTSSGASVISRHDYMPFGEELGAGIGGRTAGMGFPGTSDGIRQKFTSKERDVETGLDYFGARYYRNTHGRFTSADPLYYTPSRPRDPQQFNLYAYVRNSPLRMVDPDGRDGYVTGTTPEATEQTEKLIKKLAPGTRIDGDGKIHKPGFFRRIFNKLTGHGAGTKLISRIVDSKNVTLIRATEKDAGPAGLQSSRLTPAGQAMTGCAAVKCDYVIEFNLNFKATSSDRMPDGSIAQEAFDPAVALAHELIHADIFNHLGETFTEQVDKAVHTYSVGGNTLTETEGAGEFLTTGLPFSYTGPKTNIPLKWAVTENQIRKELGEPPRATYQ